VVKHTKPGETIICEGEPSRSLCVIIDGSAILHTGTDMVAQALGVFRAGECVGTLDSAAGPSPYSVTAEDRCSETVLPDVPGARDVYADSKAIPLIRVRDRPAR
jgi:CRP-like cAMP-binding protein